MTRKERKRRKSREGERNVWNVIITACSSPQRLQVDFFFDEPRGLRADLSCAI